MKKKLKLLTFFLLNTFIILSCGRNSQGKQLTSGNIALASQIQAANMYYIISEIYLPSGQKISFQSDISNSKTNESLFLLQYNLAGEVQYKLSCANNFFCLKKTAILSEKARAAKELLFQYHHPDKITFVTDTNGFRYTALKLKDPDEIKMFKKLFTSERI